MLYRFQECLGRMRSSQLPSDVIIYRGTSKSRAEHDLAKNRLHFARANIFDEDTQESEMFKAREEQKQDLEKLGLSGDNLIPEDQRSKEFFERADKHYSGLAYICSWSCSRPSALKFAQPLHDRVLLQISEGDMVKCFQECFDRWNRQQPGEHEMTRADGSLRDDWNPQAVRYAYGKIDYVDRSACSEGAPFRLGRAMRLPAGPEDGDLQEEDEWRISLDLSEVSSSVNKERLVKTGLLPKALSDITLTSEADELEPMISFNSSHGLWLNDLRLHEASSFRLEVL
jgi:hypothetical protein